MRVLLAGSGGREHALAWRLKRSTSVSAIICPNGNPGIDREAETPAVALPTAAAWAAYASERKVDLVVVGPETLLAAGIADECRRLRIPCFGPTADGAMLETSKSWAKQLMRAAGVPTAQSEAFTDAGAARDFLKSIGLPAVIKADGLAAGKGVVVATSEVEALEAIEANLVAHQFGEASARILIEEFLEGEEVSIFAVTDGQHLLPLLSARDHKRAFDNDQGPNTGGMGAFAPAPISAEVWEFARRAVLEPTLLALRERGIDYRGVLYAGLMLTKDGPKVLEFNCRFGDPETQVLMPLIAGDVGELFLACAEGRLSEIISAGAISVREENAVTVVVVSGGYPGAFETGHPIMGLEAGDLQPNRVIFQAGTASDGHGRVVNSGGRVVACTAWERSLARARETAYTLASRISFKDCRYRSDIAMSGTQTGE